MSFVWADGGSIQFFRNPCWFGFKFDPLVLVEGYHHRSPNSGKPSLCGSSIFSLPEFMNFQLFGKTILVVNIKFGLFWGPST